MSEKNKLLLSDEMIMLGKDTVRLDTLIYLILDGKAAAFKDGPFPCFSCYYTWNLGNETKYKACNLKTQKIIDPRDIPCCRPGRALMLERIEELKEKISKMERGIDEDGNTD